MCLPLKPYKIEREWKHAGLSCVVVQNQEAMNRCGYVRVPPGHLWHGLDYANEKVDVSVHGGLTFSKLEPCTEHEDGQGWWFGFDCAHFMDSSYDPQADLTQVSPKTRKLLECVHEMNLSRTGHFWSEAEVALECERLARQLAEIGEFSDSVK
jgi:hypothetical protein